MLHEKIGFRFKSVYEAFNAFDQNRSGAIEDEEFRNNRASRRAPAARAGIRALFRAPSPSRGEHHVRRGLPSPPPYNPCARRAQSFGSGST